MQRNKNCKEINPETMKIIRNLRGKAVHEGRDRECYINQIIAKYSSPMTIMENHATEWCIENRIIGYDYIVSVVNVMPVGRGSTSRECIICGTVGSVEFLQDTTDEEIVHLFENKGWDVETEKCPKCNQ